MRVNFAGIISNEGEISKVYTADTDEKMNKDSEIAMTRYEMIVGWPIEYISCVGTNDDSADLDSGRITEKGVEIKLRHGNMFIVGIQRQDVIGKED